MKLIFDFLPIVLFFVTFKYAEGERQWAAEWATQQFGFLVSGGAVGPGEAPVLLATLVVIAATFAQIAWLRLRRQKVDAALWVSLGLVTVLGGATIWFHNEAFIKWKPTVLYWVMSAGLLISLWVFKHNLMHKMLGAQMQLPALVWRRLVYLWATFFAGMGCLNLFVAYQFSTATWVNFKMFGALGLMIAFVVGQSIYISRHAMQAANDE